MAKLTFFTLIVMFCVLSQLRTTESGLLGKMTKRLGKLAGRVFTTIPGISEVASAVKTAKGVWDVVSPLVNKIRGKKKSKGMVDNSEQINLLASKTNEILQHSNQVTQDIMQLNADISDKLNQSAIATEALKLELLLGIERSIDSINQLKADITSEFEELAENIDSLQTLVVNRFDDVLRQVDRNVS